MENKVLVLPDIHCRSFYKPILEVKDTPIVFLGDYMDPYGFEGTKDEDGIANLEEIIDFARNNKNVILLAGNHDCSHIWSYMGFERTKRSFYNDLHTLYRDNIDLFKAAHKINEVLFTHAGVSNGWIKQRNREFEYDETPFALTQDNITDYINNAFEAELKQETAVGSIWDKHLHSSIFDIGYSRWGRSPYGGPMWSDFNSDYEDPDDWTIRQVFGHTQYDILKDDVAEEGVIRSKGLGCCVDSRAIFELDLDTKNIKRYAV